jgi:hypothetical protein
MKVVLNLSRGKKSGWLHRSRVLAIAIKAILDAQVLANQLYIRMHNVPLLYKSGVRYKNEPDNGVEEFALIPIILARGWGDCDDLAPWLCAELREAGEKAKIRIQWKRQPDGRKLYHIVVRRGDGRIEDPSALLGMNDGFDR